MIFRRIKAIKRKGQVYKTKVKEKNLRELLKEHLKTQDWRNSLIVSSENLRRVKTVYTIMFQEMTNL